MKAANLQAERKANIKAGLVHGIGPAFGGKIFDWSRGAVLSQKTIWSVWYQPPEDYPSAPWPSMEEMKEEGDERNTSGYKRFPALPRVPGNETVVWKQKAMIDPYPLDQVWELPTAESIKTPCVDETASELLGHDLLKAIDHESVPSQQHYDTQTEVGSQEDIDDSATLNVSLQDGHLSRSDLGLNQNINTDIKLEKLYQDDVKLVEIAPCDTSIKTIKKREQFRRQIELKITQEKLCASQQAMNNAPCNPLQSVENFWTASWA